MAEPASRGDDPRPGAARVRAAGKFLFVDDRKLWVRGVTYGTFAPGADGHRYPSPATVASDFAAMAAHGINAVRLYDVPPRWLLDAALEHGLWAMVGLPWEQHVAFLDDRRRARSIVDRVRAGAAACAGHPALLSLAIGNEIPAPIVRWQGRRAVERFLGRLCDAARAEDPEALVTYANYPSTEYLRVSAADFVSFNVYLEDRRQLAAYLSRLQNLAGDRPLVLAELGLDSRRHGVTHQARTVEAQVGEAFGAGCAGAFVFAWTDEWHRGEHPVLDWDFGLTDRARRPKPALAAARRAFADAAPSAGPSAPRASVVVCTYNGAATLRDCLEGATALRYPDYEVIVVDDGSTDASAAIAATFAVRLIRTPNRGLSAARNTGLAAASGVVVAYLDDDARPDPDWLTFLTAAFARTTHAGIGGPNLPPPDQEAVGRCVANAPGGPVHVLLSDTVAEHIPGCNMAFRRDTLAAIGGFDERFRVAGDDVDVCWRLQERGHTLGYDPAALVWHRPRSSVRAFLRQQRGYGRAEALLERKWPEKYNRRGHLSWRGRLYASGGAAGPRRSRVYHGTWGTEAFQTEVHQAPQALLELAATPEWCIVVAGLGLAAPLGLVWPVLLIVVPLLVLAAGAALAHAVGGARRAELGRAERKLALHALVGALHLLQPVARLVGRLSLGLAPWRRPQLTRFAPPRRLSRGLWFETPQPSEQRLGELETALRSAGARVVRGGAYDRWDLEVSGGALGAVRLRTAVEEHGGGRQLLRLRAWPRVPRVLLGAVGTLATVAASAFGSGHWAPGTALTALAIGLLAFAAWECGIGTAGALTGLAAVTAKRSEPR